MKLNYHPETDSLYIHLSERSSAESREISEGVILDYDAEGKLVGIDIDNDQRKLRYAYLNMFARGLRDSDILHFCEALRHSLPSNFLEKLHIAEPA